MLFDVEIKVRCEVFGSECRISRVGLLSVFWVAYWSISSRNRSIRFYRLAIRSGVFLSKVLNIDLKAFAAAAFALKCLRGEKAS